MSFNFIFGVLYLLIPGAIANIIPAIIKNHFKFLAYPIDFRINLFGKRLFGDNKTFRGLIWGIIGSIVIVFLQKILYEYNFFSNLSLVDYSEINFLLFGFLIGFGVLFGDLVGSFIKRRFDFKPGESFYVLDQINGGFGFALFLSIFYVLNQGLNFDTGTFIFMLLMILIWGIGHLIIKYLGFLFGIYKEKI